MFADYVFYTDEYGGSAIAEASFTLYGNRATAYLVSLMPDAPYEVSVDVKMAMCAVADEMFKGDSEHGGVQSESVGSWSRSYKTDSRTTQRKWFEAAMLYLSNSELVSRWI
ncbi:MAG: hypothetical protein E7L17_13030 [Clostridium sp.]|uniref:hypothetical protein n=1 Tax=Clostridium sp. TaxID=1506 RepID=UPI002912055F|nr:hypothetical protein [Clostridium sp.]MDU7339025.1 hypothetical protein [Clostridium sp.]